MISSIKKWFYGAEHLRNPDLRQTTKNNKVYPNRRQFIPLDQDPELTMDERISRIERAIKQKKDFYMKAGVRGKIAYFLSFVEGPLSPVKSAERAIHQLELIQQPNGESPKRKRETLSDLFGQNVLISYRNNGFQEKSEQEIFEPQLQKIFQDLKLNNEDIEKCIKLTKNLQNEFSHFKFSDDPELNKSFIHALSSLKVSKDGNLLVSIISAGQESDPPFAFSESGRLIPNVRS